MLWPSVYHLSFTFLFNNAFRQIATAVGPCGNNRDYLFLLEKALFDIGECLLCTDKSKGCFLSSPKRMKLAIARFSSPSLSTFTSHTNEPLTMFDIGQVMKRTTWLSSQTKWGRYLESRGKEFRWRRSWLDRHHTSHPKPTFPPYKCCIHFQKSSRWTHHDYEESAEKREEKKIETDNRGSPL